MPGITGKIGVKPFANILLNDHGLGTNYNSVFFGEAGLKFGIWNLFEIHVPLLVTGNIKSITGSIKDRIRIVLNIDLSKDGKMSQSLGN